MASEKMADVPKAVGERDPLLDGFRAVAVLGVIAGHALAFRYSQSVENHGFLLHQIGRLASPLADTGVYIFFAISGYIITSLMLREEGKEGRFNLPAFYVRRILRIVPPYAAYLLTVGILGAFGYISLPLGHIANAAGFTCNTGWTDCSWFVAHSWSLAVEEQYYLFWPLLFTLLTMVRRRIFVSAVTLCLMAIFMARPHIWHSNAVSFACIAAGAACALEPRWRAMLERAGGLWTWLLAAAFIALGPFFLGTKPVESLMPLLALFLLFGARSSPFLCRILVSRPLQFIGSISYSLYLWQQLFLATPINYAMPIPPIWLLPLVAWLSLIVIERPCMRLSHRLSRAIIARRSSMAPELVPAANQSVN